MVLPKTKEKASSSPPKIVIPMGHRWYVYGHTNVDADGKKSPILPIRKMIKNYRSRTHIYTTMAAADGSELCYGIPLDLDFEDATSQWKSRGKLDYKAIKAFIDETYPTLGRYLCTYTRSTRGKGLGLILFFDPFIRFHEKTGGVTALAERVQRQIVAILNFHGMGCDGNATGIARFTPNWRNKRILLHKDEVTIRRVQRENEPHWVLRHVYNELRRSPLFKAPTKKSEVLSGLRFAVKDKADEGLALIYRLIVDSEPETLQINTSYDELAAISGLTIPTLRRTFSKAAWIEVSSSYGDGISVKLSPTSSLSERAYGESNASHKVAPNINSLLDWDLCEPEDVSDGDRNAYIWMKAVLLRNEGVGFDEAIQTISGLVSRIPGSAASRNCRRFETIVGSIYRHQKQGQIQKRKIFRLEALTKSQSYCPDLALAEAPLPCAEEGKEQRRLVMVSNKAEEKPCVCRGGSGEIPPTDLAEPRRSPRKADMDILRSLVPDIAAAFENKGGKTSTAMQKPKSKPVSIAPPGRQREEKAHPKNLKALRLKQFGNVHPAQRFERAYVRALKRSSESAIVKVLCTEETKIRATEKWRGSSYQVPDGLFKRLLFAFSITPRSMRSEILKILTT